MFEMDTKEVCTVCLKQEKAQMKEIRMAAIKRLGTCQFCGNTRTLYAVPVSLVPKGILEAMGDMSL